ncbi:MAG: hypothetical protein AAF492_22295, partial [Verrucomicrobiota bacterium]
MARPGQPRLPFLVQIPLSTPRVNGIVNAEGEVDLRQRKLAVARLPRNLKAQELDTLYAFLRIHPSREKQVGRMALHSLKNDVLDRLIEQEVVPEDLGARMTDMFRDTGQEPLWRDYLAQHFAEFYRARWAPGRTIEHDPERQAFRQMILEALDETDSPIAGSTLLGLERLTETGSYPEFEPGMLGDLALKMAEKERASDGARTVAVQVAARMGKVEILEPAREWARNGSSIPLRMAAIGAL